MALEIEAIGKQREQALALFFKLLREQEESYFNPHPFTDEQAHWLADYTGKDLYCLMLSENKVLAYGLLRGWDEGYETPSLGIVVHPAYRGKKLGGQMMRFLQEAARARGAVSIRLRVHEENRIARAMYEKLGYHFSGVKERGQLVGILVL